MIYGCKKNFPYAEEELCTCYQDCYENSTQVCASDGNFYRNRCTMEVYACQKDIYLEVMPTQYCEGTMKYYIKRNLKKESYGGVYD